MRERLHNSGYPNNIWQGESSKKGDTTNYKGSMSFYFTNFLEDVKYEDLWMLFLKWGRVIDVFVPSKRDIFGKKFGFVRFLDVKDPKALEQRLDSLCWVRTSCESISPFSDVKLQIRA